MNRLLAWDLAGEGSDREFCIAQREVVGVEAFERVSTRLDQVDRAPITGGGHPDRALNTDLLQHDFIRDESRSGFKAFHAGQDDRSPRCHIVERGGNRLGGIG